jgi:hypothetical protein
MDASWPGDLNTEEIFRRWSQLRDKPSSTYHVFLGEILQSDGWGRFRTIVKDLEGEKCVVAFYPDSYKNCGFNFRTLKKGHTLAIMHASQHHFLDGTHGVRVAHMDNVVVSLHMCIA